MSLGAYVGSAGIARKVANIYVGNGGVAHKVVKGYVGNGGIARQFWSAEPPIGSMWNLPLVSGDGSSGSMWSGVEWFLL